MKSLRTRIIALLAVVLIVGAGYYAVAGGFNLSPRIGTAAPLYSQDSVIGIYDSASPAVVEIMVSQRGTGVTGRPIQGGQGSGFLVDSQGHIVTNNHVVAGATTVRVRLQGGNTVDATVTGTDAIDDLAVIKVNPSAVSGITPLILADSSAVRPGQMAIAIGSPFGFTNTITVGVISGLNRSLGSRGGSPGMLQTDATINPGNSGGPLLDANGQVVGVNTSVEAASGARGIGFAVPSNVVTRVLPALIAGKQVTRPWLGISGTALNQTNSQGLGLSISSGVYIVSVMPESPASKAGLKAGGTDANGLTPGGDVITAVDGKAVASVEALSAYLNTKSVGDKVSLSILRGGQTIDVQATLEAWPDSTPSVTPQPPSPHPDVPGLPGQPNNPGRGGSNRGGNSQGRGN